MKNTEGKTIYHSIDINKKIKLIDNQVNKENFLYRTSYFETFYNPFIIHGIEFFFSMKIIK
jgi:hypothetical protein